MKKNMAKVLAVAATAVIALAGCSDPATGKTSAVVSEDILVAGTGDTVETVAEKTAENIMEIKPEADVKTNDRTADIGTGSAVDNMQVASNDQKTDSDKTSVPQTTQGSVQSGTAQSAAQSGTKTGTAQSTAQSSVQAGNAQSTAQAGNAQSAAQSGEPKADAQSGSQAGSGTGEPIVEQPVVEQPVVVEQPKEQQPAQSGEQPKEQQQAAQSGQQAGAGGSQQSGQSGGKTLAQQLLEQEYASWNQQQTGQAQPEQQPEQQTEQSQPEEGSGSGEINETVYCDCGWSMEVHTYGMSDEEWAAFTEHMSTHEGNNDFNGWG